MSYDCVTIDCEDLTLPAVEFSACIEDFGEELSQICDVFISEPDDEDLTMPLYKPTAIDDPEAWITAVNNSGAGLRRLEGIGGLPIPEKETREIRKGKIKRGLKTYTLNFTVDEMNDANYAFANAAEGREVFIWFATLGGSVYGGANGIKCTIINADVPFDAANNAYLTGVFDFSWKKKCLPPRQAFVLAEDYEAPVE